MKKKKKKKPSKFVDDGLGLIITMPQPDGSTETFTVTEEGLEPLSDSTPAAEPDPEPRVSDSEAA
jgi:hypothetical protein